MFAYLVTVLAGVELFVGRNSEAEGALDHVLDSAGLHSTYSNLGPCGSYLSRAADSGQSQ